MVHLISPNGPFLINDQIMIGYWGENLDYQMHWHRPRAYIPYWFALFWSEHGKKIANVGDIDHKSNEKHWTKMTNGFLLPLAIWKVLI